MQFWDQIINNALLGTDKKAPAVEGWPTGLAEAVATVQQNASMDKEELFLQTAALAFNYRQCGALPLYKEGMDIAKAAPEEKQYASTKANQVLKDILDEDSNTLLQYWLQHCMAGNRIVMPDLLPVLLNKGVQQKKLQPLMAACCGKRGEWLGRFNDAWNFSTHTSDEDLWHTGTLEQRKAVLQQMRQNNPSQAREWLQQTWAQEDAATKIELLTALETNIGEDDIAFLESLFAERGKKVKELALMLLRMIPQSVIVQQYRQVLQQAAVVKKEKSMLGLKSHTSLQIQMPADIDEQIFKTGIDKLSNTKVLSDDEYIIFQLTSYVPPVFWETHFNETPGAIVAAWQKDETGKKILPALVTAIINFKDQRWAQELVQHSEIFYVELIPMLPVQQQETYSIKYFDEYANGILEQALKRNDEWSLELTRCIFRLTAKNPYQYTRAFYNQHIRLIPAAIEAELDKLFVSGSAIFNNIKTLLHLKTQTVRSFNE